MLIFLPLCFHGAHPPEHEETLQQNHWEDRVEDHIKKPWVTFTFGIVMSIVGLGAANYYFSIAFGNLWPEPAVEQLAKQDSQLAERTPAKTIDQITLERQLANFRKRQEGTHDPCAGHIKPDYMSPRMQAICKDYGALTSAQCEEFVDDAYERGDALIDPVFKAPKGCIP